MNFNFTVSTDKNSIHEKASIWAKNKLCGKENGEISLLLMKMLYVS